MAQVISQIFVHLPNTYSVHVVCKLSTISVTSKKSWYEVNDTRKVFLSLDTGQHDISLK